MTLVLALASWTALLALALRQDPHAANDSALLLANSTYADGLQYIPTLFIRTWADASPGLAARILAWLFLAAAAAFWVRRAAGSGGDAGRSPLRALAGIAAMLLVVSLALERLTPATRTSPKWRWAIVADAEATVFLQGASVVREDEAIVGPGAVEILVRAPVSRSSIVVTLGGGGGFARVAGRPPHALRPTGGLVEVPLSAYHEVRGRGRNAAFSRGYMWLDEEAVLRPMRMELGASEVR
jgi:hypothetical protein